MQLFDLFLGLQFFRAIWLSKLVRLLKRFEFLQHGVDPPYVLVLFQWDFEAFRCRDLRHETEIRQAYLVADTVFSTGRFQQLFQCVKALADPECCPFYFLRGIIRNLTTTTTTTTTTTKYNLRLFVLKCVWYICTWTIFTSSTVEISRIISQSSNQSNSTWNSVHCTIFWLELFKSLALLLSLFHWTVKWISLCLI